MNIHVSNKNQAKISKDLVRAFWSLYHDDLLKRTNIYIFKQMKEYVSMVIFLCFHKF
jgi:hypothetical protein